MGRRKKRGQGQRANWIMSIRIPECRYLYLIFSFLTQYSRYLYYYIYIWTTNSEILLKGKKEIFSKLVMEFIYYMYERGSLINFLICTRSRQDFKRERDLKKESNYFVILRVGLSFFLSDNLNGGSSSLYVPNVKTPVLTRCL